MKWRGECVFENGGTLTYEFDADSSEEAEKKLEHLLSIQELEPDITFVWDCAE